MMSDLKKKQIKIPKIDLEKVDELEERKEEVTKIIWNWAEKSLKDPDLPWDTAMDNAAKDLGVNYPSVNGGACEVTYKGD